MKSPLVWIGKVPRASVCSADARVDRFRRVLQGSSGFWSLMVKKVAGFRNYLCYGIAIKKNSRVPCTVCDSCAERVEKMFFSQKRDQRLEHCRGPTIYAKFQKVGPPIIT